MIVLQILLVTIVASTYTVASWGLPAKIVGLWVDEFWHVQVVSI